MAKRIIKTGIGTYVDQAGLHQFGFLGSEVNVHDDDLERFDRLNIGPAGEADEAADAVSGDTEPDPTEGLDVDGLKAYAEANGIDIGRASSEDGIRAKIAEAQQA